MAAAVVQTTIFTFGGQTTSSTITAQQSICAFDTANPGIGWTTSLPNLPSLLAQASAVTVGTAIYITGGYNSVASVQRTTLKYETTTPATAPQNINVPLVSFHANHASFYNPDTSKIHVVGSSIKSETVETLDLSATTKAWTLESTAVLFMIRTGNSGGFINNRFYLPGGSSFDVASASSLLYVLDFSSPLKWVPYSPNTVPSYSGVMGKVGTSFISGLGYGQTGTPTNSASQYNPSSDTWSTLGVSQNARVNSGTAVLGSELYSIGGFTTAITETTIALNAGQTAWVQKGSMNVARQGLCAASEGTKIFAYGGKGVSGVVDTMEIYEGNSASPAFNTWTDVTVSSKSSFSPTAVMDCVAISTGTKILIFGGRTGSDSGLETGIIQSFDIASQKWDSPSTIPSTITPRYLLSASIFNGYVILTGGTIDDLNCLVIVEAFNIASGIIYTLPDMFSPRKGHGSFVDGNSLFVVGGYSGGLVAPVEKYRSFP